MRFAYGNVSIAKFLASSRSDRQLKKTSMYANRHDWWVTSNEGSSDDGSGDSFEVGSLLEEKEREWTRTYRKELDKL